MRIWMVVAVVVGLGCGTARADTIDDFVLTGNGHTTAFSLPASNSTGNYIRLNAIYLQAASTVDGVGGYTVSTTFYFNDYLRFGIGQIFSVSPTVTGVGDTLRGSQLVAYDPLSTNTVAVLDFVPGTYSLMGMPPVFSTTPVPYTLTITPEMSLVPEPGAMLLVGTGLSGIVLLLRIRQVAG